MGILPIKPTDISPKLEPIIPEVVIKAVNEFLKDRYTGGDKEVIIKQKELVSKILKADKKIKREEIFDRNMLDFESLYAKNGWKVVYHSPDRDESFDEFFAFTPKK